MTDDVGTCAASLLNPGVCCIEDCHDAATTAVLVWSVGPAGDLPVEHARCPSHDHGPDVAARKPLRWDPVWGRSTS